MKAHGSNAKALTPSATKKRSIWQIMKKYKMYYFLLLPGLLYLIIFHYIPLFGVIIAFKDYHPFMGVEGIFTSEWVGFKHFKKFFNSYLEMYWETL